MNVSLPRTAHTEARRAQIPRPRMKFNSDRAQSDHCTISWNWMALFV